MLAGCGIRFGVYFGAGVSGGFGLGIRGFDRDVPQWVGGFGGGVAIVRGPRGRNVVGGV